MDRVNSVNHRLFHPRSKRRSLFVNPKCERTVEDFCQVLPAKDGSRRPRKGAGVPHELTHLSDAVGYYVVHEHSVRAVADGLKQAREDDAYRRRKR